MTVFTASGTGQTVSATFCYGGEVGTAVICAPDDGWSYHPKHAEQFTEI
jgi:hypothetical protein